MGRVRTTEDVRAALRRLPLPQDDRFRDLLASLEKAERTAKPA